jgi:type II secretory pathway pseudopilin PulG
MRRKLKSEDRRQKTENKRQKIIVCSPSSVLRPPNMGFTLTEVIVASTLLIIAMVPILKALTSGHVTSAIIQRRSYSLILAQAKLDEIKARSIYNYNSSTFTITNESLDGSYLCNINDDSEGSNLRKITISVGYDINGNGQLTDDEIEVTLATYLAKRWDD